jgi:hypothetical protein
MLLPLILGEAGRSSPESIDREVGTMRPRDAEKLLGGYAAGILTEEEKRSLFSAALERQELFEALADEEALRELLADPESRKRLLALLDASKANGPVPFWRRPVTLGLAASLLAMMTTSLVLWRRENPLPIAAKAPGKQEEAQPASEAPSRLDAPRDAALARRSAPEMDRAKGEAAVPAPSTPRALPAADASMVASELALKAEAMPERISEPKKQFAEPPSAAVEVVADQAAMDKTETTTAISRETLESLPANRAVAGAAALSPGVAAGDLRPFAKASAKKDRAGSVPAPVHVLERLDNGVLRLTVTWATGHHLYLLKRGAAGVTLLAPRHTRSDPGGKTTSIFEFSRGPMESVDLYLLPRPALAPKNLPAEEPIEGFRHRLP